MPCSSIHFITADFIFFSCTGSNSHINYFSGIKSHFFCKISFDCWPLHSYRAFSTGNMRKHFRIIGFSKFDPGRTATGKLWQRFFAFCDTFHQLTGFFHDSKVSSKISIQHIICPQFFQQRYHFSFNKATVCHSKFFT